MDIIQLSKIEKEELNILYTMLENITIPKKIKLIIVEDLILITGQQHLE